MDKLKEKFIKDLEELLQEDVGLAKGKPDEAIYKIDNITVYGDFYSGIRGVDHKILLFDYINWENIIEWGTIVVPENKVYISDSLMPEFENLGYTKLPTGNNHIQKNIANANENNNINITSVANNKVYDIRKNRNPDLTKVEKTTSIKERAASAKLRLQMKIQERKKKEQMNNKNHSR